MIRAYQSRQRRELLLMRAATIGTPEAFEQIMVEAFPAPAVAAGAPNVREQWW